MPTDPAPLLDDPAAPFAARGHVGAASHGRPWRGLAVWMQHGPAGALHVPAARCHCIVVRRGAPTRLVQRQGDGAAVDRIWRCGEAIVVPAGTPSWWHSGAARDNLHIDLDPSWLVRATAGDAAPALRGHAGIDDPVLRHFGALLLQSLASNASLNPGFGDALALALAAHLVAHHAEPQRRTAPLTQRQLALVAAALESDLAAEWSIERMAALLRYSPFHFARAFKAACGETPQRHLRRLRMEHARRLVLASAQPLVEIAVDAGFASLSHFGQTFRRQWGVSPSRLRRAA